MAIIEKSQPARPKLSNYNVKSIMDELDRKKIYDSGLGSRLENAIQSLEMLPSDAQSLQRSARERQVTRFISELLKINKNGVYSDIINKAYNALEQSRSIDQGSINLDNVALEIG